MVGQTDGFLVLEEESSIDLLVERAAKARQEYVEERSRGAEILRTWRMG